MSRDWSALTPRTPRPTASAAEQFVSGHQTSAPDVQTSGADVRTKRPKAVVRRRGGRLRRRRTVYLPLDTNAKLERFCLEQGREVSSTVAEAVALLLAQQDGRRDDPS